MEQYDAESVDEVLRKRAMERLEADVKKWKTQALSFQKSEDLVYLGVKVDEKAHYGKIVIDRMAKSLETHYFKKYLKEEVDRFMDSVENPNTQQEGE